MWRILGNSSFSQTGLRKRYQEAKATAFMGKCRMD